MIRPRRSLIVWSILALLLILLAFLAFAGLAGGIVQAIDRAAPTAWQAPQLTLQPTRTAVPGWWNQAPFVSETPLETATPGVSADPTDGPATGSETPAPGEPPLRETETHSPAASPPPSPRSQE